MCGGDSGEGGLLTGGNEGASVGGFFGNIPSVAGVPVPVSRHCLPMSNLRIGDHTARTLPDRAL